ncbi:MAG: prepilin-type N-terminal cleavage/methylation domain-containing protein [bacterium]|nr:prepilin-type N-terminal cleavage/methylation domain-containing protein [bacterium]
MFTKDKRGFTLIELLVVIAIIGLLSTLAVVALQGTRVKSRDAKRVADIKQVQTALELYSSELGSYPVVPAAGEEIGPEITSLRSNGWNGAAGANIKTYMGQTSGDPRGGVAGNGCVAASAAVCNYTYAQPAGQTQQYNMFFFLEETTGSLSAGIHCATEAGISSNNVCNH